MTPEDPVLISLRLPKSWKAGTEQMLLFMEVMGGFEQETFHVNTRTGRQREKQDIGVTRNLHDKDV